MESTTSQTPAWKKQASEGDTRLTLRALGHTRPVKVLAPFGNSHGAWQKCLPRLDIKFCVLHLGTPPSALTEQLQVEKQRVADCRHKGRRHGRLATLEHAPPRGGEQLTAHRGLQSNAWRAACAATQNNAHTRIHTNPTKIELQQPLTAPGRAPPSFVLRQKRN